MANAGRDLENVLEEIGCAVVIKRDDGQNGTSTVELVEDPGPKATSESAQNQASTFLLHNHKQLTTAIIPTWQKPL